MLKNAYLVGKYNKIKLMANRSNYIDTLHMNANIHCYKRIRNYEYKLEDRTLWDISYWVDLMSQQNLIFQIRYLESFKEIRGER